MDSKDLWMVHGGPAFPSTVDSANQIAYKGMSLRDYFAAAAINFAGQLLLAEVTAGTLPREKESQAKEYVVMAAYEMADAMLKERERANSPG